MEKSNKYYDLIIELIKENKKFAGHEAILDEIADDVYNHAKVVLSSVTNEDVVAAYLEKVISTSIITVSKKLNHNVRPQTSSAVDAIMAARRAAAESRAAMYHYTAPVNTELVDKMINGAEPLPKNDVPVVETLPEEVNCNIEAETLQEELTETVDDFSNTDLLNELSDSLEPAETLQEPELSVEEPETLPVEEKQEDDIVIDSVEEIPQETEELQVVESPIESEDTLLNFSIDENANVEIVNAAEETDESMAEPVLDNFIQDEPEESAMDITTEPSLIETDSLPIENETSPENEFAIPEESIELSEDLSENVIGNTDTQISEEQPLEILQESIPEINLGMEPVSDAGLESSLPNDSKPLELADTQDENLLSLAPEENSEDLLEAADTADTLTLEPDNSGFEELQPDIGLETSFEEPESLLEAESDELPELTPVDDLKLEEEPIAEQLGDNAHVQENIKPDYSCFNYTPEPGDSLWSESDVRNALAEIEKKNPEYNIDKVYELRYNNGCNVKDISTELNLSEEKVIDALIEISMLVKD